jgi:hypothetical protein
MTTPTQTTRTDVLKARLELGQAHPSPLGSGRLLFEEVLSLRESLVEQAWEALSERGLRCLGLGHGAFRRLQGEAIRAGRLDTLHRPIAESFVRVLQAIAKSEDSADFARAVRETLDRADPQARLDARLSARQEATGTALPAALVDKMRAALVTKPSERIDIEDSLGKLSAGRTKDVSLLAPFSPPAAKHLALEIEHGVQFVLLSLCRGLQAVVHAELNRSLRSASLPSNAIASDDFRAAVGRILDETEGHLRGAQRRLYGALVAEKPMPEVADIALSLAGDIERELPMFVRAQAAIRLAMLQLREQGKGTASERLGRLGMRAGAVTRDAIASHCAAYRLAVAVLSPQPPSDMTALIKRTSALPFAVALPDGKNTELNALGPTLEGAFVEIEGFVTEVSAGRESDGKLVSHLALMDPSSGGTADAVVLFVNLANVGVTRDAYCRLHGTFKTESGLFQGKPAVEVGLLPLAELSKTSWLIAFLRSASRWFQPWRNGANLYWSLGPHGIHGGDEFLGAGELLFAPLIRR